MVQDIKQNYSMQQKRKLFLRTPELLFIPLRLMPVKLHSQLLVTFLNRILSQQLKEGELDFLENRSILIKISDAKVLFNIGLSHNRLVPVSADKNHDLVITARVYDFLMLTAREEDPDTLVFQRRLTISGDTELGLELKYFLDGLDIEASKAFSLIHSLIQKSLPVSRRLFS